MEFYKQGVTMTEIIGLTGASRQKLNYWMNRGLFDPIEQSKDNPRKIGHRFDLQAVQTVLTIQKLRDQGVSLQKVREAVETLRDYGENLSGAVLYTDGSGVYRVRKKEELLESLNENPGQLENLNLISLDDVDEKAKQFYRNVA